MLSIASLSWHGLGPTYFRCTFSFAVCDTKPCPALHITLPPIRSPPRSSLANAGSLPRGACPNSGVYPRRPFGCPYPTVGGLEKAGRRRQLAASGLTRGPRWRGGRDRSKGRWGDNLSICFLCPLVRPGRFGRRVNDAEPVAVLHGRLCLP